MQFHGKEMHTLCFISEDLQHRANGKHNLFSRSSWIATGCENGTVRLNRYDDNYSLHIESDLIVDKNFLNHALSFLPTSKPLMISFDFTWS